MLDFWFNFDELTKKAVLDNYLVNLSGRSADFQERDLLQEHHNLSIKGIHNGWLAHFDSKFLCEAVSLNIVPLSQLATTVIEALGLCSQHSGRSEADLTADINFLGHSFLTENIHLYQPSCSQSYTAIDALSHGHAKLCNSTLQSFLDKHVN